MTRVELKTLAKQQIKGNIGMLFVCTLIIGVISGIPSGICARANVPWLASVISLFITPPLSLGLVLLYLGMTNGEAVKVDNLFNGFKYYKNSVLLFLLQSVFIFLWTCLFIIPGIIKTFSYSMCFYILAENPEMGPKEALDASKEMMDGHKMDLFVLQLSFIPWILLTAVTCGIAGIYTVPYMTATTTNFYLDLKKGGNTDNVVDAQTME